MSAPPHAHAPSPACGAPCSAPKGGGEQSVDLLYYFIYYIQLNIN